MNNNSNHHTLIKLVNSELKQYFIFKKRYVANWESETNWQDCIYRDYAYVLDDNRLLRYMYRDDQSGPGWTCICYEGQYGGNRFYQNHMSKYV